jgi:hypothetical protein
MRITDVFRDFLILRKTNCSKYKNSANNRPEVPPGTTLLVDHTDG